MRLVTWNCKNGGYRRKSTAVATLCPSPDIVVAQEVEPLTGLLGELQPSCMLWKQHPSSPKLGVGVFGYAGATIEPVDLADPMAFGRYRVVAGGCSFQLVAVWSLKTPTVKTCYQQAHEGIERHAEWIRQSPTVILGDFNNNSTFKYYGWLRLTDLMDSVGLASAYHHISGEKFGCESRPTYYHCRDRSKPFHIDFCFVPKTWLERIRSVEIGHAGDWETHSDHMPLIVDIQS